MKAWHNKLLSPQSRARWFLSSYPAALSLAKFSSATQASLLFLKQAKQSPGLGTLHRSSLCPGHSSPSYLHGQPLNTFKSWLPCQLWSVWPTLTTPESCDIQYTNPSDPALFLYHVSSPGILCDLILKILCWLFTVCLLQLEYTFHKRRNHHLFCPPSRQWNTDRMNEWHITWEVQYMDDIPTWPLEWAFWALYLVQLLELHHLEEDVLKDMFGILPVLWEFIGDSEDVATLPDIEFQVFFSTWAQLGWLDSSLILPCPKYRLTVVWISL